MTNTFCTADPHFCHNNIINFKKDDGSPLRPYSSVEEMNEALVDNWNKVVGERDRIYVLGDLAMSRRGLDAILPRLKGRKVLVKGNHDEDKLSFYSQYFDDIRAYVCKKGFIMSHIPIHPESLSRWKINIHGHTHYRNMMKTVKRYGIFPKRVIDERYVCVSVEQTNFTPISLDEILKEANLRP